VKLLRTIRHDEWRRWLCVAGCLVSAVTATAQIITPLPQEPVASRSAPVYSNPGVVTRSGQPQTGRLPQGSLPQGVLPGAGASDYSRRVPIGSAALPAGLGQSKAYYYLTNPQAVPTNGAPQTPTSPTQSMLGGRVLSTGQDDILVTLVKMPRFYDAELRLVMPESRLLGTNFNAGARINLGKLPAGEIVLGLKITSTGLLYPTGPGLRNPDGYPHAVVQNGGTPEAPLVYVGFEDMMTANTSNRQFNDAVVQLSGGVVSAILAPVAPVPQAAQAPAPAKAEKVKKKK
jgi:hypothetical protein